MLPIILLRKQSHCSESAIERNILTPLRSRLPKTELKTTWNCSPGNKQKLFAGDYYSRHAEE